MKFISDVFAFKPLTDDIVSSWLDSSDFCNCCSSFCCSSRALFCWLVSEERSRRIWSTYDCATFSFCLSRLFSWLMVASFLLTFCSKSSMMLSVWCWY